MVNDMLVTVALEVVEKIPRDSKLTCVYRNLYI